ncbi:MAG: dual specificity protein phosphatase family protein [Chloroflexota bacterium]
MPYTDYDWVGDRFAIGGLVTESDHDFPFDAVLSMETHAPATLRELAASEHIEYRWFSIIDGFSWEQHDEIVRRFTDAADQLSAWLAEDKKVLVHCTAGISRSATVVIWYLVRHEGYTWEDGLAFLRSFRSRINPNARFEIALRLSAGEKLSEGEIGARIRENCDRTLADGFEVDPAELWRDLEKQGTLKPATLRQ